MNRINEGASKLLNLFLTVTLKGSLYKGVLDI